MREECRYYYIANDGKEFEDEEECFKYEQNLLYGDVIKNNELQMFDYDKHETTKVEQCFYLKCDSIKACELFIELCDRFGAYTPFIEGTYGNGTYTVGIGTWYYDEDYDRWISLEDLEDKIKEIKEIFE